MRQNQAYSVLPLLAASLLLAGCGSNASSSASSSKPVSSSSASASMSSEGVSSSSASMEETSSSPASSEETSSSEEASSVSPEEEYGQFEITPEEGFAEPTYDENANAYYFNLASSKATYALKGYFDGSLIVQNGNGVSSPKGLTFILDGAYLTNTEDGGIPISYEYSKKTITIKGTEGTENHIVGNGSAIHSENNAELAGAGSIYLSSLSDDAVDADTIRVYETPTLDITAYDDALSGKEFDCDNGESDDLLTYQGAMLIHDVGDTAFSFAKGDGTSENPYEGTIRIGSGAEVKVTDAAHLAAANELIDVAGQVEASLIAGDPIVTDQPGALQLTVEDGASLIINGTAFESGLI
jgi:hypothetical protein